MLFPDNVPGRDLDDASGNNANYYFGNPPYPIESPYYTTVVGEFQNSDSSYGTFDQGGNVFEWNEAVLYGSYRGVRGGSFSSDGNNLLASFRSLFNPSNEHPSIGFRVFELPEPATIVMLSLAGVAILRRKRA